MNAFNFADSYKLAGLDPAASTIDARQKPFNALRKGMDDQMTCDLVRLYFGLDVARGTEWFREPFAKEDSGFTLVNNKREVAVLACGLLQSALEDKRDVAALAVLTASAAGHRKPKTLPNFVSSAKQYLYERAVAVRSHDLRGIVAVKVTSRAGLAAAAKILTDGPDLPKAVAAINAAAGESSEILKIVGQLQIALAPLAEQTADTHEEMEILWWFTGGYSRLLNMPLADLDPALMAMLVGIDLADLTRAPAGAMAVPYIMQRVLPGPPAKGKQIKLSAKQAVDEFGKRDPAVLGLHGSLKEMRDLCPVLASFSVSGEASPRSGWPKSYKGIVQLDASSEYMPIDLATQVYRERKLLTALGHK